jgi:hypothetical protein
MRNIVYSTNKALGQEVHQSRQWRDTPHKGSKKRRTTARGFRLSNLRLSTLFMFYVTTLTF